MNAKPLLTGALLVACLGGCLQDLEGGPARVQVHSTFADTLTGLSIGSWGHRFDPILPTGATSETFELPASGSLQVDLHGRHEGRDTILATRSIRVGVGEFLRVE